MKNQIIGVYTIANCASWIITSIDGETAESMLALSDIGYKYRRTTKIHYTTSGRPYIRRRGTRLYLDQFMRV